MHHKYVTTKFLKQRLEWHCSCVFTSGEDSGVHESGHAEVGKSEEEDHSDVDGNERGQIIWQPRAPGKYKKR